MFGYNPVFRDHVGGLLALFLRQNRFELLAHVRFHDPAFDVFGIACSGEENVAIFLDGPHPAFDIAGMALRIMAKAQFGAQHVAANLGAQFLFGIDFRAKRAELPGHSGLMAGGMAKLMKGGCVIVIWAAKGVLRRQMDFITHRAVKGAISLIMKDWHIALAQ